MKERYIYFNSRDTFFRVQLKHIIYFVADKNYTTLLLKSGRKIIFTYSLQKMEEYLRNTLHEDSALFARIGRSHIINLNYVFQIDIVKQQLILFDSEYQKVYVLDISKEALKKIRNLFLNNTVLSKTNNKE